MTGSSIAFFLFGAIVLWGGIAVTVTIAIRDKS
ncbi:MAG: MetS family NSS transporter small subunit [Senegalia sp. (in: firmicutes)]